MTPLEADERRPGDRRLVVLLIVLGGIGLLMAAALLVEKIRVLEDPAYVPICSFNPILSCGNVMNTDQAEAFGVPNPIIGVAGFAIVLATGAALAAGAVLRRWYWIGLQAGVTFGVVFVHWLMFQSLYRIGALCPYCMVVWAVTIPLFLYVTVRNLTAMPPRASHRWRRTIAIANEFHGVILTMWCLVIVALIGERFWDYWVTLFP